MRELRAGSLGAGSWVRQLGGGRSAWRWPIRWLTAQLERIMDENTAGDPMSLLEMDAQVDGADRSGVDPPRHPISDETCGRRRKGWVFLAGQPQGARRQFARHAAARSSTSMRKCGSSLPGARPCCRLIRRKGARGRVQNPDAPGVRRSASVVNVYDFPTLGTDRHPYGAYDLQLNRGL